MGSMAKSIMIIFISFLFISSIFNVQSATTGRPDVKYTVDSSTNHQTNETIIAPKATIVGESLASPSDTKQFAPVPVPEGVIIEPVPVDGNNDTTKKEDEKAVLIKDDNLMNKTDDEEAKIPILIKDDNLIIKPTEEDVSYPILIRDDNLMIKPKEEEVILEPVPIEDDNITVKNITKNKTDYSVSEIPQALNNTKTEHIAPTTPPSLSPLVSDHSFGHVTKPCPDYETRYENGEFIVTLDDGKCEMIVSENIVSQDQRNQWASGRYTPIYQLLSRKYKPQVTFRQTSLAQEGHNCKHRTRQTGTFFVVDTVLGRCQMVIGIPTLPDLRYALANSNMGNPGWNRPVRRMPTFPRKPLSSGSDSED